MTDEAAPARERRWVRPLGLLAIALAFAVGQPLVVTAVAFAFLALLASGGGVGPILLGAAAIALVFAGEPGTGLWYLERGWAIVVGGWFAALSLAWPGRPFFSRALFAVAGASAWAAAVLLALEGWGSVQWLVEDRVRASAAATMEFVRTMGGGEWETALPETLRWTAELQTALFPALLALSTLAALGVAWWTHVRLVGGSDGGLGPLRNFRFADPLMWVLIGGLALLLVAGWGTGWGRLGANLTVFMAGLYALRGVAVLVFLSGGVSVLGGLLLAAALLLAGPLLVGAALLVGIGDAWLDLRSRAAPGTGSGVR